LSFISVDERGWIVPKTPKVAIVAAQTYLLNTQPTVTSQVFVSNFGIKKFVIVCVD
jgi:hypothetical protein